VSKGARVGIEILVMVEAWIRGIIGLCCLVTSRRIDPGDHHGPGRLACVPRGRLIRHAADGSIDGVKVHERQLARRFGSLSNVCVNRLVRPRFHKVALPIALEAFWKKGIEQRLGLRDS